MTTYLGPHQHFGDLGAFLVFFFFLMCVSAGCSPSSFTAGWTLPLPICWPALPTAAYPIRTHGHEFAVATRHDRSDRGSHQGPQPGFSATAMLAHIADGHDGLRSARRQHEVNGSEQMEVPLSGNRHARERNTPRQPALGRTDADRA